MWLYLRANVFILVLVISLWTPTNAKILKAQGRIAGGFNAPESRFPYIVSLQRGGVHHCGGAIISRNYILTAAHCVVSNDTYIKYDASRISIRAGSNNCYTGGSFHKVAEVKPHPNYNYTTNDIAVLRLAKPLVLSGSIRVVPLRTSELPSGSQVLISGWGYLNTNGSTTAKLQYNSLKALSTTECNRIRYAPASELCLAHTFGNGACYGDSGGPGIYHGRLVGIANAVFDGCGSKWPDGFANVTYFNDWIRNNTDL